MESARLKDLGPKVKSTTPTLADPSEPKTEPISAIASASPGINQDGLPAGQGVLPSTTRSQS
ncbi:hypothetical protein C1H46_040602 [Malus baccata]|uniref:Uncharacterized protein n=1 Tax=Malus baccata TaxID=106549 RepID=A0A540KI99_MALBA|nr:hypothetical protein C1H46_040602 [Malus baccata]